jgi:hypothetical protein
MFSTHVKHLAGPDIKVYGVWCNIACKRCIDCPAYIYFKRNFCTVEIKIKSISTMVRLL